MAEITDLINSHRRQQEIQDQQYLAKMRDHIRVLDGFANALLQNLSKMISGGEFVKLETLFPGLFTQPEPEKEKPQQEPLSPEMQVYKAQRFDHAYRVNKRRNNGR